MYSPGKAFVVYEMRRHVCGVSTGRGWCRVCYLTLPTAPSPVTTHCTLLASVSGLYMRDGAGAPSETGSWEQPSWKEWLRVSVEKEGGHLGDGAITTEGKPRGVSGTEVSDVSR